jgi:hypothetical protein
VTLSRLHAPTVATLRAYRSTDPEGRRLTYTYSCGNGRVIGPTTASTAKCTYLKRGTYYIRLTVKDDIGQRSSVTVRIRV